MVQLVVQASRLRHKNADLKLNGHEAPYALIPRVRISSICFSSIGYQTSFSRSWNAAKLGILILVHPSQECAGLQHGDFQGICPVSNGTYLISAH